jgi:hypothetical protein
LLIHCSGGTNGQIWGVPNALAATIKPFANNSESASFFMMLLDDGMDPGGRITESEDRCGPLRW